MMMKPKHLLYILCSIVLIQACKPVSQIQSGDDAYQYKRYAEAAERLPDEIEASTDADEQARKSYWLGESKRLTNQDETSVAHYRKAYELSKNQISLEAYAYALLRNQQYTNAKKLFAQLIDQYGTTEEWNTAMKSCNAAKAWIVEQNPNKYVIKRPKFNSPASEYAPVFYDDILVFTSDREESKGDSYHWNKNAFTDFYRTGENVRLDALLFQINSPYNDAAITFNEKLDHAVYTQCGTSSDDTAYDYCRLVEAVWNEEENRWSEFKKLPFCRANINYGHPTFFDFDQGIIFSSKQADGHGGFDLYVSYKSDDEWSDPVLLPKGINSPGNERFPVMQGDTLFYASDGKVGMGGLDIFMTKWVKPSSWTTPVNMKPPINSGGDDFGFVLDPTFKPTDQIKNRFYISSNRKGSNGDDIYQFDVMKLASDTIIEEKESDYEIVIEGKVSEQLYENPADPNSRKIGTRPLPDATIDVSGMETVTGIRAGENGEFSLKLTKEGRHALVASKPDYLNGRKTMDIALTERERENGGKTYIVHLLLDPIVYNAEIVMESIYYDFDKSNIREDAREPLEELAELLNNNPQLSIELASHTDCQGLEIYNAELSQRRAQSAVDYLVGLGISKNRLRARGYGESKPAIDCVCEDCSDEEHQTNRRTAFSILK